MAVADLYAVTASLRSLVRLNIWRISGLAVTVTDLPPEKAEEEDLSNLNLHLFHAVEDASKRNEFPIDSLGGFPIAEAPLPLILYYVLTAHSPSTEPDIPGQQRLMGLAMKTFHDFPAFDDRLEMPAPPTNILTPVFDPAMRGRQNKIEIIPRQLTPEELVNFWSAAQNHTARLTAYYEVRSTLLPPDEPDTQAGLVTSYGLGVSVGGRPRLTASSSVQTVAMPASMGGGTLATSVSPAEAAIGSTATPSAARITATGHDLGDGTSETLLLTGPEGVIEIDPTANPDWEVRLRGDALSLVVQPSVQTVAGGMIVNLPILPGVHTLAVRRRRPLAVSSGEPRTVTTQSNAVPIAIGANVGGTSVLAAPARLRIDLSPGVDAMLAEPDSALSIAGVVYRLHPASEPGPLAAGEYRAVSATRFEAMLDFDPTDGEIRLVRFGIAGVDTAPFWVTP
ncbi:DUF4255 domain-containing protein [Sphingomonas sp. MMS12-HWE2-04]|uniref:DUF4255 domain-containing protein n=1 Tax=Sphingomonas sp. MMS12-HWE2-04 TaxID=3234199 RepID=UPI00384EE21F